LWGKEPEAEKKKGKVMDIIKQTERYIKVIKQTNQDGTTYNGYKYKESDEINDFDGKAQYNNKGFYGWALGYGLGDGKNVNIFNKFAILEVDKNQGAVQIDTKLKFKAYKLIKWCSFTEAVTSLIPDFISACMKRKKQSGDYSSAGQSGDYSSVGQSGNCCSAGQSGYYSSVGQSGNYSSVGQSGNYSSVGQSGYRSSAGQSGNCSSVGQSGNCSSVGQSGKYSSVGQSGDYSSVGQNGYCSSVGQSGDCSSVGQSGDCSSVGQSGDCCSVGQSGDRCSVGQSGDWSACAITGEECTVDTHKGCIAVSAKKVYWILRKESCLVQWWREEDKSKMKFFKASTVMRELELKDGDKVVIYKGIVYR